MIWNIDKTKESYARLHRHHASTPGAPPKPMPGASRSRLPERRRLRRSRRAYGGNMDYAGMTAGVKLMLPVNETWCPALPRRRHAKEIWGRRGGGHQCRNVDGRQSRVGLVEKADCLAARNRDAHHGPRKRPAAPRGISDRLVRNAAVADADYGFSERGASDFMGQTMEYEIANVVDPNFTVVAKMRKSLLPGR